MQKKIFVLIAFVCGITSLKAQSVVDTLYYDKEWKGVMEAEFAQFCRITITPEDPNFPKRFKDYDIRENYLQSEGTFVSIDKYDDSKSVFTSLVTYYFPNGKVMSLANYNNGKLDGTSKTFNESGVLLKDFNYKDNMRHGLCVTYYSNGNVESSIKYDNDVVSGDYMTYTENGAAIFNGTMEGDVFTGIVNQYNEEGILLTTEEYKSNVLDGTSTMYYPNGDISATIPFTDGLINGVVKRYNRTGVAVEELSYVNGLKCGICEYRDGDNSQRITYKEVIPSDGLFGISATIVKSNYDIYSGSKIRTIDGAKTYRYGYGTYFREIGLSILNNTDKDISGSLENITIEYIKKDKASKNMVISETVAMNVYKEYADIISKRAYANAESTANAAATQRTQTSASGYGNSTSSAASSTSANSSGSVVGAILAGVAAASNNGYAVGTGGAVGGAKGQSNSNTTSQAYGQNSTSQYNSSSGVYVDGQVRYQVYQQEKEKADKIAEEANAFATRKIEENKYSEFVVPAHSVVDKVILVADTKKKFDSIRVSFDYNGKNYTVVWEY